MIEPIITLKDFMESDYNNILNAQVILEVDGERIEVTEEVSTPEFFEKYEDYKIEEIRPCILKPKEEDFEEEDMIPEYNVHFELGFLVVLVKYFEASEDN